MTAIVEFDRLGAETMRAALGPDASTLPDLTALADHLGADPHEDCIVLGPSVSQVDAGELAESMRIRRPSLGVVLVRQRIDAVVLTEALRSGIREVVPDRDLGALAVAVQRVHDVAARQRSLEDSAGEGPNPSRRARVVTVFSAKGGCGKTTLATNMAAALASSGRGNVVLVDLDLAFGDVAIAPPDDDVATRVGQHHREHCPPRAAAHHGRTRHQVVSLSPSLDRGSSWSDAVRCRPYS